MGAILYYSKVRQGGQKVNHVFFVGNMGLAVFYSTDPFLE